MATGTLPTIYHESYGDLTRPQLAAYKRYNVSPSDHYDIEDAFGDDHRAATKFVVDHSEGGMYRAPWPFAEAVREARLEASR